MAAIVKRSVSLRNERSSSSDCCGTTAGGTNNSNSYLMLNHMAFSGTLANETSYDYQHHDSRRRRHPRVGDGEIEIARSVASGVAAVSSAAFQHQPQQLNHRHRFISKVYSGSSTRPDLVNGRLVERTATTTTADVCSPATNVMGAQFGLLPSRPVAVTSQARKLETTTSHGAIMHSSAASIVSSTTTTTTTSSSSSSTSSVSSMASVSNHNNGTVFF